MKSDVFLKIFLLLHFIQITFGFAHNRTCTTEHWKQGFIREKKKKNLLMSYCQRQTCWQEAKVWSTTEKQGDWGTRCYAFRWKTNSNVITALPSSTSQHIHSYSTDLYHSTYCILDPTAAIQIWIPPKRFKQQIFLCFTKLWIHNIIINIIFLKL